MKILAVTAGPIPDDTTPSPRPATGTEPHVKTQSPRATGTSTVAYSTGMLLLT